VLDDPDAGIARLADDGLAERLELRLDLALAERVDEPPQVAGAHRQALDVDDGGLALLDQAGQRVTDFVQQGQRVAAQLGLQPAARSTFTPIPERPLMCASAGCGATPLEESRRRSLSLVQYLSGNLCRRDGPSNTQFTHQRGGFNRP
jgi:hypothetical protein